MSEQFNVFFRQVLVARQFVIFVTPVAAFLIVWRLRHRVDINADLLRSLLDGVLRCLPIDFFFLTIVLLPQLADSEAFMVSSFLKINSTR